MSEFSPLKLDPWAASSLLQKAIRRGETELAKRAAHVLYRYRGAAIFRRLCLIAVEDIGIADTSLVQDVVRIGTDKALRSVLGSDAELIDDLCSRMAATIKDRSADYLICAATKLETALHQRKELKNQSAADLIAIATNEGVPLTRRAVAALLACTSRRNGDEVLLPDRVEQLLDGLSVKLLPLHDAVLRLARARADPFCLMLPLIWSRWWHAGAKSTVAEDELPAAENVDGIPLYTFDKHTAAGKSAIKKFVHENEAVRDVFAKWVPRHRWAEVGEIATFYADAAPVARRLEWPAGSLLAHQGFMADMMDAGCVFDGANAVFETVVRHLDDLNQRRRLRLGRSLKK